MDNRKKARQFIQFISDLRDKRNVTMEQLCEGLCSRRMAWYLESGERAPDKLLQDRILERLGVGAEDYEYFLFYDEYDRWVARQRILHNITYEKWERAEQLLREYSDSYDMGNVLEKQFYLSMLAQIRRHGGETSEALGALFEKAARLTVPELENKPLEQLALSLKELNLILEAERCRKEGERPQRYQEIADYILANGFDGKSVAKLYPKVVYFLCRSVEVSTDPECRRRWTDNRLLVYCNQALERTYAEFHVPKETFEYCCLYVVKGVSCINDVIRVRRKMFGMSRKELCGGICDIATLRRLERRETVTHREIAEKLFERLGLSTEFARTNLVTASHEAKRMMMQLRECVNERKWDDVKTLREQIEGLIAMDIPSNRQVMMRQETISRWHSGEISRDEYLSRMRTVLELTLPCQAFYSEGEQYLTNEEQVCIFIIGYTGGQVTELFTKKDF